jgi:hypothetical protein
MQQQRFSIDSKGCSEDVAITYKKNALVPPTATSLKLSWGDAGASHLVSLNIAKANDGDYEVNVKQTEGEVANWKLKGSLTSWKTYGKFSKGVMKMTAAVTDLPFLKASNSTAPVRSASILQISTLSTMLHILQATM